MIRLLTFALLALGLAAAASAQPTHTLTIEYEQRRGDLREATLTITPTSDDAPPLWRGDLDKVAVLSTTGQWVTIDRFLSSSHSTGLKPVAEAKAFLPTGETVLFILLKPRRGPWRGWKVEEGEGYTEVEWTYFTQNGEAARSAPCEPRACFAHLYDSYNQSETLASSFRVEIDGFSFGVERE